VRAATVEVISNRPKSEGVVMSQTWNPAPVLGLVGQCSARPAVGGPPVVSPDGHWWWNGSEWVVASEPEAAAGSEHDLPRAG
jgi:hypothetical protein